MDNQSLSESLTYLPPTENNEIARLEQSAVEVYADAISRNPAVVYLSSLSPGSRRTTRQALNVIAGLLGYHPVFDHDDKEITYLSVPWHSLKFAHTSSIRARLAEKYAPPTTRKMLCALRGVLKNAWKIGLMTAEDYWRARELDFVRGGSTDPKGRLLSFDELEKLFDACAKDKSAAGRRDSALLSVLRGGGLRRAEVCGLKLSDFSESDQTLRVFGKGRKIRKVPLAPVVISALREWIETRGLQDGALFTPVNKYGSVKIRHMVPEAIFFAMRKRALEAGLLESFSPHDLRRTMASMMLADGTDISTVAKILGHSQIATTQKYDLRSFNSAREAVQKLDLPFKPRGAIEMRAVGG